MDIVLYKCLDTNNTINKTLENGLALSITLKRDLDPKNPVFVLNRADVMNYNYIKIVDTGKFYFINNFEKIAKGTYKIYCSLDVIETYKADILASPAVYARQAGAGIYGEVSNFGGFSTTEQETITKINSDVTLTAGNTFILNTLGVK